jgi:hypothetical protein
MKRSRPFKPSICLFVIVLAAIGCGLPTSFGGNASGSETATAPAGRATELAESINDLESQVEGTQQAEQETATRVMEQEATAGVETATAKAIAGSTATQSAAGTATQVAVDIAKATATSEAFQSTLESIADDPAIPEGYSLVFLETFDDNDRDWVVGGKRSEYGYGNSGLEDGFMEVSFDSDKGVHWHQVPDMNHIYDFYMSIDIQRIGGEADCHYGVVFRHLDYDNFYSFEVDDLNQRYWVYALQDGDWYFVFSGFSSAIKYNEVNRLAVAGEGNTFTLYVNDYRLGQVYDNRFRYGKLGVAITLPGPNNEATWRFDNLAVYAP